MVVFGDSDFVSNGALAGGDQDLFMSALNWLLDREELMAIAPKPIEEIKLSLTRKQLNIGLRFWRLKQQSVSTLASLSAEKEWLALVAENDSRHQAEIEELLQKVLRNEIPLDANVGPQLWLVNKDFTIRTSLWSNKRRKQLSVNLNTATAYELATFSGISLVQAKEIVGRRDEFGYFKSYEDAEAAGFKPEAR